MKRKFKTGGACQNSNPTRQKLPKERSKKFRVPYCWEGLAQGSNLLAIRVGKSPPKENRSNKLALLDSRITTWGTALIIGGKDDHEAKTDFRHT